MPPLGEEQLLEAIAAGDRAAADIAREAGMSILELARIVTTPRNLEALARVKLLHAIEREMLLGTLKRDALVRLAELTDEVPSGSADEIRAFEVMRKACVDLLRFGGSNSENRHSQQGEPSGGGPRARGDYRESITPASEAEVLEALERLGEELNEDEPRVQASGSVVRPLVPWSKAKTQATREGVVGVEVTDEVQVGMAFGKTSDHGTESMRTGKMPVPLVESPSQAPLESRLPIDPGSLEEPGADASGSSGIRPGVSGGRDSGTYSPPARNPLHQPRPPPHTCCLLPIANCLIAFPNPCFSLNTEKRWRYCRRFRGGRASASSPSTAAG